jgi:hypothetical protein
MTDYGKMIREFEAEEEAERQRKKKEDMINNPAHYNKAGIECVDAIAAATGEGFEYYLQGNILKYLWRYRYKNGSEDLKKAQWYLNRLIKEVEGCYDGDS